MLYKEKYKKNCRLSARNLEQDQAHIGAPPQTFPGTFITRNLQAPPLKNFMDPKKSHLSEGVWAGGGRISSLPSPVLMLCSSAATHHAALFYLSLINQRDLDWQFSPTFIKNVNVKISITQFSCDQRWRRCLNWYWSSFDWTAGWMLHQRYLIGQRGLSCRSVSPYWQTTLPHAAS